MSDSDGSESELSETEQLQIMLELQYKRKKRWKKRPKRDPKVIPKLTVQPFLYFCVFLIYQWLLFCTPQFPRAQLLRYKYFSAGLLSHHDRYPGYIEMLEEQLVSGEAVRSLREADASLEAKVSGFSCG